MNRPDINVTPLIDILLVLLIIFMVVSPVKPTRFEARIPAEPDVTAPVEPHSLALIVAVNSAGEIALNSRPLAATTVDAAPLVRELAAVFQLRAENGVPARSPGRTTESTVFVKAPRSLPYGEVARVVDAVKLAGADPVSLQIDGLER